MSSCSLDGVGNRVERRLARNLAQVVSEPIFDVPRLVEAARHQRFDPILGGWSPERSKARITTGAKLAVRRQAGVDKALGVGDRPFVEFGDPRRERLYDDPAEPACTRSSVLSNWWPRWGSNPHEE